MKDLVTMTINSLLEEISVCETMSNLVKIKKIAKAELKEADPDTKKTVERLISYKMRLITNNLLKYATVVEDVFNCDRVANDNKNDFYNDAYHFFKHADIPMILGLLSEIEPYDSTIETDIKAATKTLNRLLDINCRLLVEVEADEKNMVI